MARRRPDSTSVGPWFRVGVDILEDIPLNRLRNKADRWRYIELLALAKISVNHTSTNSEIGDLLAGFNDPMRVEDIALKMKESPAQVEAFLERLREAMPRALTLREGRLHLQNFAKRQFDYPSDMPHSGPAKAPSTAPNQPGPESGKGPGLEGEGDVDGEGEGGKAPQSPRCGWCENPKPETAEATQRLLQGYHDAYRAEHGACPTMTPGRDGKALKSVLAAGKYPERILAVIGHGLRSEDPFLAKRGFALCEIIRNFDGIALALDKGYTHGSSNRNAGRNAPKSGAEINASWQRARSGG